MPISYDKLWKLLIDKKMNRTYLKDTPVFYRVYHFVLYELIRAVKEVGTEDAIETLETLVQGKRLKDISDLPLDLAV